MHRVIGAFEQLVGSIPGWRANNTDVFIEPLLLRLFIPGWSQLYNAERVRAKVIVVTWATLVVLGLVLFGTIIGSTLLGLAVSVHTAAGMDILARYIDRPTMLRRVLYSIGFFVLLVTVIYLPAQRVLTYFAEPFTVMSPAGEFATGDILLVNHAAFWRSVPQPGQLVYFNAGNHRMMAGHMYFDYAGNRFDRILAGPGDKVSWAKGRLTVNGKPSALRPVNPARLPDSIEVRVPDDRYLIFPTTVPPIQAWDSSLWMEYSLIARDQIEGVVYFRKQPIRRMKVLH